MNVISPVRLLFVRAAVGITVILSFSAQGVTHTDPPPSSSDSLTPASGPNVSSGSQSARGSGDSTANTVTAMTGLSDSVGTWTPLINQAPDSINYMLLLSDGTVMAKGQSGGSDGFGNSWYRLTPDANGSYINGTWTTLAGMHDTRLYFSMRVLEDGKVFIAGGEYGTGKATAEVYDPTTNTWTQINPPTSLLNPSLNHIFRDSESEILPNGKVLVAPVYGNRYGDTLIYDPGANLWSDGPILANGVRNQLEASWVKLPDASILTIDPFGKNGYSERYIPSTNQWISDSTVPANLYDPYGLEIGAGLLLPNGQAFFLGSTGLTALYTPSGTTSPGNWTLGPALPDSQGTPDAPAAMMVNGRILCAVSPLPTSAQHFPSPTSFYEYDYTTNSFAQVNGPTGLTDHHPSYECVMLDLPDGTVLYATYTTQLYVYRPSGSPLTAGKPTISTISDNGDGSYALTGTLLNGISEGAAFGDDWQMATNYPIVRLSDSSGDIYYAGTYNWDGTGVMTGNTLQTANFRLPPGLPSDVAYSLSVVANGIASDSVPFIFSGPTIPTAYPATNVTSSGFTADWSSVSGATGYRLDLSTSSSFDSYVSGYQDLDVGNTTSASVSGLNSNTSYYYRVRAYSEAGTSGNSNIIGILPPIAVTVQTSPAGATYAVDGITYNTAQVFSWQPGSSHAIGAVSPQSPGGGIQYLWNGWSDHGALSHTVAPIQNTTYTGNFTTQYYLTMTAGTGGKVSPASAWKNSGSVVPITATPTNNSLVSYNFAGWAGTGTGVYTGTNNPASITMSSPISETASFTQNPVNVTVQTSIAGPSFTVDGNTYSSAQTFSWQPGSSHTIATTSPQSGGTGNQYKWSSWSDGGTISHTVAPTTNKTYTAKFTTQYYLTMTAGTGGKVSPASGWKNSGTTFSITATPAAGYTFTNWSGTGPGSFSGITNPASVTMGGPITEAASFTHN